MHGNVLDNFCHSSDWRVDQRSKIPIIFRVCKLSSSVMPRACNAVAHILASIGADIEPGMS